MDFNGGGGIVGLGGGGWTPYVDYNAQNNANLAYVNNASQASYNPQTLYGPGGFGGMTNAYSAAGAAYGRATGGFGGYAMGSVAQPSSYSPSYGGWGGDSGGGGGTVDRGSLSAAMQSYYDEHVAKYGYAPDASNPNLGGGASFSSRFGSPTPMYNTSGLDAINNAAGIDPSTGKQFNVPGGTSDDTYAQQHLARYGYLPGPADFAARFGNPGGYQGGMMSPYNWQTNQSSFNPSTYNPSSAWGGFGGGNPFAGYQPSQGVDSSSYSRQPPSYEAQPFGPGGGLPGWYSGTGMPNSTMGISGTGWGTVGPSRDAYGNSLFGGGWNDYGGSTGAPGGGG